VCPRACEVPVSEGQKVYLSPMERTEKRLLRSSSSSHTHDREKIYRRIYLSIYLYIYINKKREEGLVGTRRSSLASAPCLSVWSVKLSTGFVDLTSPEA
jgi:hypothetical protein